MDPIQITVGAFAGRAATRAINAILGPEQGRDQRATLDTEGLYALTDDDDTYAVVTDDQLIDIERFLETKEVASLLQSWLILTLSRSSADDLDSDLAERIAESFLNLVEQWCSRSTSETWASLGDEIWKQAIKTIQSMLPRLEETVLNSHDSRELFARFTPGSELIRGQRPPAPAYIRDIVTVFGAPERLVSARAAAADIARECRDQYSELFLAHIQEDHRFTVDELYVNRTLNDLRTKDHHTSELVLTPDNNIARSVIIGDPGVGKSTLVRHLVFQISDRRSKDIAPLLVQVRDYAGPAWGLSFITHISNQLSFNLGLSIDEQTVTDILTIGTGYLIFDGVDEIIDLPRRREFIKRVEAFARRYPLASVVCTARRVGYSRARFDENLFATFELEEFSPTQFSDYVQNWFQLTSRSEGEVWSFMRESETLQDIRYNPLMLSLLCALYRARGYLPRNRRQVYRDCADLLFQRWDAMRHIEQPFDHRQYGQKLMQEIARFYYQSQRAQAGVEEQQLVRLVAIFLRDTASVDPPDDEMRARQFVEFCADRAWLLTTKGTNDRGIRLFGFTHRTFMEYLAGEALVRNLSNIEELANAVITSFISDPSSVMPDVIVQAADDKFDRGGEQVLIHLFKHGHKAGSYGDKYLSLCLRAVNSCPMSRAISDSLAGNIQQFWQAGRINESFQSSVAFFELYRDPRARLIRTMSEDRQFRNAVCSRWARLYALGHTSYFESDWRELLEPFWTELASEYRKNELHEDKPTTDYLLAHGYLNSADLNHHRVPALLISTFGFLAPGILLRTLLTGHTQADQRFALEQCEIVKWYVLNRLSSVQVPWEDAPALSDILADYARSFPLHGESNVELVTSSRPANRELLLWLCLTAHEHFSPRLHPFINTFSAVMPDPTLLDLIATRTTRLGIEGEQIYGRNLSRRELDDAMKSFGSWARAWVLGKVNLIEETPED